MSISAPLSTLSTKLAQLSQALPCTLSASQQACLLTFINQLVTWNHAFNLTAIRDPEEMLTHHLMDSLVLVPHLHGPNILDVGTGAGLPGIPLAIACPQWHFTLLDAQAKRVRFLRQTVHALSLQNVTIVQARIEDYSPAERFDTIVSRAFTAPPALAQHCSHLLAPDGRLLAQIGPRQAASATGEGDASWKRPLPAGIHLVNMVALDIPGLSAQHYLAVLRHRHQE